MLAPLSYSRSPSASSRSGSSSVEPAQKTSLPEPQPDVALAALAALLPETASVVGSAFEKAASCLDAHEAKAVRDFETAGQRCLAALGGATLLELQRLGADLRVLARSRPRTPAERLIGGKTPDEGQGRGRLQHQESLYEIFERYDSDHNGSLSIDEFKSAYRALTKGKDRLSQIDIDAVVKAADINGDGNIDIHEFVAWLYGAAPQGQKPTRAGPATLEELRRRLAETEAELEMKRRALAISEKRFEEEMEAMLDFWRSLAESSGGSVLGKKVNVDTVQWLGNGKYGYVCRAVRRKDNRQIVVKLLGIRWAHLAAKEWQLSSLARHANIVEYEDALLHRDDNGLVRELIQEGFAQGKLKSRQQRAMFPDGFICLMEEFMNRGTVQDWMDKELLQPSGMFVVLHRLAGALAYMHGLGLTHNDIKPENVMLHQDEHSGTQAEVVVKLGDLGLAAKSSDTSADFWQYGMTLLCMVTGEKFGSRKFRREESETFVGDVVAAVEDYGGKGRMGSTLSELPGLLRGIFSEELSMKELQEHPSLQDWGFFSLESVEEEASPASPRRTLQQDQVRAMKRMSMKRVVTEIGGRGGRARRR